MKKNVYDSSREIHQRKMLNLARSQMGTRNEIFGTKYEENIDKKNFWPNRFSKEFQMRKSFDS